MGFFSYLCAKSGKSISASAVCEVEVVGYYPDGRVVRGVYDGYGRIGYEEYSQEILFEQASPFSVENVRLVGGSIEKREPYKDFSYRFDVAFEFFSGNEKVVKKKATTAYVAKDKSKSLEEYFADRLGFIKSNLDFDEKSKSIKIVLASEYDENDTFESLPSSQNCPHQGFFYPDDYDFGVPDASFKGAERSKPSSANPRL
jgi:hypothetical protein